MIARTLSDPTGAHRFRAPIWQALEVRRNLRQPTSSGRCARTLGAQLPRRVRRLLQLVMLPSAYPLRRFRRPRLRRRDCRRGPFALADRILPDFLIRRRRRTIRLGM